MSSLHFLIQFVSRLTCSQIESGHIKCFGNVRGVNVPSVIIAGIARQFSTMCVRWSRHLAHLERLILNSECGVLWAVHVYGSIMLYSMSMPEVPSFGEVFDP